MRLAPTSTVVATDLEPNQRIVDDDGKRWIIDHVIRRADGVEAYCFPAGREVSKRTCRKFKHTDTVTVELSPEIGKGILDALIEALAESPACKAPEAGSKTHPLITIEPRDDGGWFITGTKPHVWQLELEP